MNLTAKNHSKTRMDTSVKDIAAAFARIGEVVQKGSRFVIVSHLRPDGDALGSSIALGRSLQLAGKEVEILNEHGVPENLSFMPGADLVQVSGDPVARADAVFVLDTGDKERIGEQSTTAVKATPFQVVIDHHITNKGYGDINLIDVDSPATGQIIYQLIRELQLPLDAIVRDALYVALSTDTGSFQYGSTTGTTMRIVADLIDEGADVAAISQALYATRPLRKVRLMGELLHGMEIAAEGRYSCWALSREVSDRLELKPGDKEGLVEELRAVDGVVVAALFDEQHDGSVRVSLRSKEAGVDVSKICTKFGGGGHRLAAGASLEGPLEEAKNLVSTSIINALNG